MRLYNYWWLLIWPLLYGIICRFIHNKQEEIINGEKCLRWKYLFAFIMVIPLVIWAGWRKGFGDTEMYRSTFKSLPSSFSQIGEYMKSVNKGYGFRLIELLFKCLISNSDIAFFVFVAVIQLVCLVYIYRKYSLNYWLSIFLFIASTDYLSWMHNGIRQFIAASIIFLCVPLIAKKRYWPAIIIILLTSQIHAVALIYLPFVFIINGKAWNYKTLLFMLGVIIAIIFVDNVVGFLAESMEDTAYQGDISILRNNDGTNIFRVLFYSVPAVMSLVFRSYIDRANNPLINVCANLAIVTMGFYIFSFFTSGILMGAIPILFSLSNYILIPWLLREVYNDKSVRYLEIIFVVVYSVFFYYQCGPTWNLL